MRHLVRAGALLVVVFLFLFVGLRLIPVPSFLADFGFHSKNTAENAEMWASLPVQFVGTSVCHNCHPDNSSLWESGKHRAVSCENCHGPAQAHVESGAPEARETRRELCGTCHARLVSRPANFPQVDMETMGGGKECITCHNPHEPRVGIPPEVPHQLEERSNCQSCHYPQEPLGILPPRVPHSLEGRADCLSCHGPPEIRGAALPHPPHSLEGRADCLSCHGVGKLRPVPEDHLGRKSTNCLNCHRSE